MKKTPNLKLDTLELGIDGQTTGRTYLEIFSGVGENNLKKIDDFAGNVNKSIQDIKNSPSTIFISANKETDGIYTAIVSTIPSTSTDLIINGIYVIKLDSENSIGNVTIRINGTISKELKKISNNNDESIVSLSAFDFPKNTEKIFRYDGQFLILINSDSLTLNNRKLSDIVQKNEIVDSLDSKNTNVPLSANQGSVLDNSIKTVKKDLEKYVDSETDLLFNDFKYDYNASTGVISLSLIKKDDTIKTISIDLPLELLIESGKYNSENKTIELILANGNKIEIPVQDLVDEYFADETTLTSYIDTSDENKLKFKVKDSGISESKLASDVIQMLVLPYTHKKIGTVHHLNGTAGASIIQFTAIAAFENGDTFTVNDTVATVTTIDGDVLYTGDFTAGQCVIAAVGEGKLTFPWRGYGERLRKVEAFTLDAPPETHRTTFRGKNLGTEVTAGQKAHIQDGTFRDLYLGDYWEIGGHTWRIVDIDYWYNCGDTAFTKHHLVIMPDDALYNAQMNETNITTGGYVGSKMYTTNLANAKTLVSSVFGSAVLVHRDLLVNAVSDGCSVGGAWYDSSVELPNEIMMYGSYVHTPAQNDTIVPYRYTINKSQLSLFQACPKFIANRSYNQWLRDVVSAAVFAYVNNLGNSGSYDASYSLGVRPVFPIG